MARSIGATRSKAGAVAVALAMAVAWAGAARAGDVAPAGPPGQAAPAGGGAGGPPLDGRPPPTMTAEPSSGRWYGWQIFLADAATVGMTVGLAYMDLSPGAVAGTCLGSYLAGPVVVHLARGEEGAIFGSVVRRILFPLGGLALGALLASGDRDGGYISASVIGAGYGALVGTLTAMVWDWTSHQPATSVASSPGGTGGPATRWAPSIALERGSVALGLAGTW
jgi:hypothetical protein